MLSPSNPSKSGQPQFDSSYELMQQRVIRLRELTGIPEVHAAFQTLMKSILTENSLETAREILKTPQGVSVLEAGLLFGGLLHHPCFIALTEAAETGSLEARACLRSAFDRRAIYAGSFDPFTLGHRDIAARAARIFDEVIIAVGINPQKKSPLFTIREKIAMIKEDVRDLPGHFQVISFQSLVASRAQELGSCALIRGVRGVTDLDQEIQQALANRLQGGEFLDLDTCVLIARQEFQNHSSTNVRALVNFRSGNINPYLSASIAAITREKVHGAHLQEVWNSLFAESALRDSEFVKVCSAYRESSRFHHNIEHIFDMLLLLDECIGENPDLKLPLKEMKAAIFFHDFVYDSRKGDNEQQSSAAAREVLHNLGWGEDEIARVCAYIDATISHKVTANLPGCDIFLDLDLSILGTGRERYSRYAQDIRREYSQYSDQDFYRGRADFLEKFLERRRLFASDWGYERFERLARDNINAELRQLRAAAT